MRTSGRGRSESLMFIAPAAIFGALFLWMSGGPRDVAAALDQLVLHGISATIALCSAAIEAISKFWA